MQKWNLGREDPLALTMACDARLGEQPDYTDDQIWRLSLGGGEPPALGLWTSYGLRARMMRVFPSFSELKNTIIDPQTFHQPPVIQKFYPNFITLTFSPFPGIDVIHELWVPGSHSITGRITIMNHSIVPRQIIFEMNALLSALDDGACMAAAQMGVTPVLSGKTGGLSPVLFITGGPEVNEGSYPALKINMDLQPEHQRQVTWCLASLSNVEDSFDLARQTTARRWDAEAAHIQQINLASQIEIYTGDPEWDAAFALSQKTALGLFMGRMPGAPDRSIVLSRHPDQGYSRRSDGGDYTHHWNGQSALDVYYLLGFLLPGSIDLAEGLLCNFLATQAENGWIDWKPGPGGQRGYLLVQPLLASLVWKIYRVSLRKEFLERVFPSLLRYIDVWFDSQHDQDQDGIPEWEHPFQSGLDQNPLFDRWRVSGQGVDITTIEDPALASMLLQECKLIQRISDIIHYEGNIDNLGQRIQIIQTYLNTSWDGRRNNYRIRDRDSHSFNGRQKVLGKRKGSGVISIEKDIDSPRRLLVRILSGGDTNRIPHVRVMGMNGDDSVEETLDIHGFHWILNQVTFTTQKIYTRVEKIEIEGLSENDQTIVRTIDLSIETIASLLPLWAHIPDQNRAKRIIDKTILNNGRYDQPFGFPMCPNIEKGVDPGVALAVHPVWNTLIGEGLLSYGFRMECATLVSRIMQAVVQNLKREACFRAAYRSDTGEGIGDIDHLLGLAPLSLFMDTLGVEILSSDQIILRGNNPFPWPITVKYRGLTLIRRETDTWITFPDGQTTRVSGPDTRLVSFTWPTDEQGEI